MGGAYTVCIVYARVPLVIKHWTSTCQPDLNCVSNLQNYEAFNTCVQFFGASGLHSLSYMGPAHALLMLDTRSERNKEDIISKESYKMCVPSLLYNATYC